MKTTLAQDRAALAAAGIHLPDSFKHYADDASAVSALQPGLLTQVSSGIPAYLANILDPKVIEVLVKPVKAAKITGERGMGTWTTLTAQFPLAERAGEVSSYGDFDNNGMMNANYSWIPRQQYVYQGICVWGDRELEMMGLAKIDHANQVRAAKTLAFSKFQNTSYFFGVANLQNFGLLNDPSLPASITPITKTGGGTSWAVAKPEEILQDITNLFAQLQAQTGENVTSDDRMILALSGLSASYMNNTNQYGLSVKAKLAEIYPKLEIETAPEYALSTGQFMQLIAPSVEGQETLISAYGDKLRAFPVFRERSSFSQKFSAGTWGCIIKFPPGIASMLGI